MKPALQSFQLTFMMKAQVLILRPSTLLPVRGKFSILTAQPRRRAVLPLRCQSIQVSWRFTFQIMPETSDGPL